MCVCVRHQNYIMADAKSINNICTQSHLKNANYPCLTLKKWPQTMSEIGFMLLRKNSGLSIPTTFLQFYSGGGAC